MVLLEHVRALRHHPVILQNGISLLSWWCDPLRHTVNRYTFPGKYNFILWRISLTSVNMIPGNTYFRNAGLVLALQIEEKSASEMLQSRKTMKLFLPDTWVFLNARKHTNYQHIWGLKSENIWTSEHLKYQLNKSICITYIMHGNTQCHVIRRILKWFSKSGNVIHQSVEDAADWH